MHAQNVAVLVCHHPHRVSEVQGLLNRTPGAPRVVVPPDLDEAGIIGTVVRDEIRAESQ